MTAQRRDKKLKDIVKALKKEFKPKRLFLFGSRSQDIHHSHSDYDFVVVVDKTKKSRLDNMFRASSLLQIFNVNADVFVYSQKEFDEWKNELSSIPETALNTGKEIDLG